MRTCDDCSLCCTLTKVIAIDKQEYQSCTHCVSNRCTIYEKRPNECKTFYCEWVLGNVPIDPKTSGIMVEKVSDDCLFFMIEKHREKDWCTDEVVEYTDECIKNGISIVTSTRQVKLAEHHTHDDIWDRVYSKAENYKRIA